MRATTAASRQSCSVPSAVGAPASAAARGTRPRRVDVRLVTATNRVLRDEVPAGRFRDSANAFTLTATNGLGRRNDKPGKFKERLYISRSLSPGPDVPGSRGCTSGCRRAAAFGRYDCADYIGTMK